MEAFSGAYLRAVAAAAGYGVSVPVPDDDSVDFSLSAAASSGYATRPKLDVQLKACYAPRFVRGNLAYPLKQKNYLELIAETLVPRILVVVLVPKDPGSWLTCKPRVTLMRARALWRSLRALPPNDHESSTTDLSETQRFTPDELRRILGRVHRQEAV